MIVVRYRVMVMASRRQQKIARVIRESVSDTIANRLNDPRIDGFVSVTDVDVSPDLRNAEVGLSIMASTENAIKRTFAAIEHARSHIQALLGERMTSKYCPRLHFHEDKKLKKTMETLNLIDSVSQEFRENQGESAENECQQE
jgi:ribosome-binding factor A